MPAGNCACHVTLCVMCDYTDTDKARKHGLDEFVQANPSKFDHHDLFNGLQRQTLVFRLSDNFASLVCVGRPSSEWLKIQFCSSRKSVTACNATHGIAWESCPSVCPSVCQTRNCDKTWQDKKNGWWGPLLPEILGKTDPVYSKTPIFNLFLLVAPQP